MGPDKTDLRLLLLQVRDHPSVRREEIESFAQHGGVAPERIDVLNVFDRPAFPPQIVEGYDALLVGGASEASVLEPDRFPFVPRIIDLLLACIDTRLPVFASCFGFQAAVVGLGGEVLRDEEGFEMDTLPLTLTPAAASDPIFEGTPDGFLGVSCHQERTLSAPAASVALATSAQCLHAFRVRGAPFWAFQFHPELDRQRFAQRLGVFRTRYTETDDHYEETVAKLRETPEANALVGRFLDWVVSSKGTQR
ncbi:MAG: aminotransferase [Planctomycetes bacterium]|nr:aminotransferase [Planctomycetota bacterium]